MPGVYREKECPYCGVKHRKKGNYCSKSCSNKGRDQSVYQRHSVWARTSEKGQENTFNLNYKEEKDPRIVPGRPRENNTFISGGDLWTVDDNW